MLDIFFIISLLFCHSIEAASKHESPSPSPFLDLQSSRKILFPPLKTPSSTDTAPDESSPPEIDAPAPEPDDTNTLTVKLGGKFVHPDIKKICDSTDYTPVCLTSIKPFLNGESKADPASVLEMQIKAAMLAAKSAHSMAAQLSKFSSTHAAALKDCEEMYGDALDNYQEALAAIPTGDTSTMNSMLSAALADYGTCDDGLSGVKSPMSAHNDKLHKMSSNCLAIVSLIKN
ncbi:hypothetical protein Ancab_016782 [Ancistrocladus abbreviatus]